MVLNIHNTISVPLTVSLYFSIVVSQIFKFFLHNDDQFIIAHLPGLLNNVLPILLMVRIFKTHPLHTFYEQVAVIRSSNAEFLPGNEVAEYEWAGFPDNCLLPQGQMSLFIDSI